MIGIFGELQRWSATRYWVQGEIAVDPFDKYPNFFEANRQIIKNAPSPLLPLEISRIPVNSPQNKPKTC